MDVPGLNEKQENISQSDENDLSKQFYFANIFPIIQNNIKFAIFIFDCLSYKSQQVKSILSNFIKIKDYQIKIKDNENEEIKKKFELKNKKIKEDYDDRKLKIIEAYKNSIFIFNKTDKFENEEEKNKSFKEFKKFLKTVNGNIEDKILNENCIDLSSKMLNLKIYKYNSFLDYINYILNECGKIHEEKDFIKFLKKNLIQDFNLNKNSFLKKDIIEGNEEEKKEMKNLNDTIINKFAYNKSFSSIQDFKLYKKIFDENKDKIKLNEPNKEKLEKLIISKMEKILIDYLDIDDYYALKRKIADAIENKDAEKTFGKINEILEKFKKEPKKLKNEMEFLNKINEYRISITNIDKESPFLQEIEKKSKELNNSLNNTSGIRFLVLENIQQENLLF